MRILVVGAGVLGCNIAANFYKTEKDVTLFARGEWYDTVHKNGLRIKNKFSIGTKAYQVKVINELKEDDLYDVIFVSLRFTQLSTIYDMLNKNGSVNIVFNGNNTRVYDVVKNLPDKNIMFSFSISAGHREADCVKSIDFKKITIGDLKEGACNKELIENIFDGTGYKVIYQHNMGDYLLSHAAFVVPVAFACYYANGNLKNLKKDNEYLGNIIKANIECYEAVEKTGHEILPKGDQDYKSQKYFNYVFKFYKLMCATSLGKICASNHAMNAVDEMQALAVDMKEVIKQAGLKSPVYDELWKAIDKYLPKGDET